MGRRKVPKCGAYTKRGGLCQNDAGFRTEHYRFGKCYLHGGDSPGAPMGNKNAVTTGEYETLHISALTDEEVSLHQSVDISAQAQAEGSVRLMCIREHRILLRIRRVQEADIDGMAISKVSTFKGWNVKGKVDYSEIEQTSTLATIQLLDDALGRVQALKIRAIEQLRNILKETSGNDDALGSLCASIDRAAAKFAAEKPTEDA